MLASVSFFASSFCETHQRQIHAQDVLQHLVEALDSLGDPQRLLLHEVQVPLELGVHLEALCTA